MANAASVGVSEEAEMGRGWRHQLLHLFWDKFAQFEKRLKLASLPTQTEARTEGAVFIYAPVYWAGRRGGIWTNSQRSTVEGVRGVSVLSCLLEFSGNFQFPQICLIFLTRLGICELLKTNAIVKNLQVVAIKATTVSSSVVRVDFILCEYNAHWSQLTVGEYWPACSVHSYKPKFNNGCFCTASHKG